jgi:phytoene synthase
MLASEADHAACRSAIRAGSKTFHAASWLLPARVRKSALALYAFCREADDAIDQSGSPAQALEGLQERLRKAYRGEPIDNPADRALADVVVTHAIPYELPAALLEGFAWDAEGRVYPDLETLKEYAVRVAGTVGVMMSLLMGVRSTTALARAAELGIAMQLSNIARDVGEDAHLGRIYLPRSWLSEAGLDADEWLKRPEFTPAMGAVIDRLLLEAENLYVRAVSGITELPADCRPAIHAARLMYAEIGREVGRRDGDSVSQRAVVSGRRKALLIAQALSQTVRSSSPDKDWPVEPAAQFLLTAVEGHDRARGSAVDPLEGESDFAREVIWVLGIFERIEREQRERLLSASRGGVSPAAGLAPSVTQNV